MLLLVMAVTAAAAPDRTLPRASACPTTTSYHAWKGAQPLTARMLTGLPSASAYMAVYRRVGRCEAPMTMVEYSTEGRRR